MPVSHRVDLAVHIGHLESTGSGSLEDLEQALAELVTAFESDSSFGVLFELKGGAVLLAPTRALSVAGLFASQLERLRGPVAVCAPGMEAYATGRLIALFGRYRGMWMEAFQDRQAALRWLSECMEDS